MIYPLTFINKLFEYNSHFSHTCCISHLLHCFDLEIRADEYKLCIFSLCNFFRILTIGSRWNRNTKWIVQGFVVNLAQVAAALRRASVPFNSAWHKQEDGQSILRSERSRNRKVAGPYVPIRRIVRSSVWLCVYTKQLGSDLDGFYKTWCWLCAQNCFSGQINLAMLSVRTDERSVVYYIQDLTPRILVEGIHHQKRKMKRIAFTNASIRLMCASQIFRTCDLLEKSRDQ